MKLRILLVMSVPVMLTVAVFSFYFYGTAGAATETETVSPSVIVSSSLSLTLEDATNVQWGNQSAGSSLNGTMQATISSNTGWTLTVKRSSDTSVANCGLMGDDGNNYIHSSNFTYTSVAGSPAPPGGSGVTTTQFDTSDTNVWTEGAVTGECRVAITYDLQIPSNQEPQAYTATHTYTLASS